MNLSAKRLIELNQKFYTKIGEDFDNSRQYFWQGWEKLESKLKQKSTLSNTLRVLDLGCGNARFAQFLCDKMQMRIEYTGLDFSSLLLQKAENSLQELKSERFNYSLYEVNLLSKNWSETIPKEKYNIELALNSSEPSLDLPKLPKYDIIVCFGVLHHIPTEFLRDQFFQEIRNLASINTDFIFTTWQFLEFPRLAKKVLNFDLEEDRQKLIEIGLQRQDLEQNDYILDWQRGQEAFRYCHYYTKEEITQYCQARWSIEESFLADGKEGNVNRYYVAKLFETS